MNINESSCHGVVVITGAGQGIGRGLALAFAESGATAVGLADLNLDKVRAVAKDIEALGVKALPMQADVSVEADCTRMMQSVKDAFGRIDVALCNAGIMQIKPMMDLTGADWDRMMGVNVKGCFLTLQAAVRVMKQQAPVAPGRPRGKVITMASIAGRYGAGPIADVILHYRASKAAVINMTQGAAIALAPDVTVNAICPGLVDTDMWKQMDRDWAALQGLPTGEVWKQRTAGVPMGRPQQPKDVANVALFLSSPAADYMTGQSLNIDGGLVLN